LIRIYLKNEFWQELRKSESLCTLTVRHKSRHGHAHAHGHGNDHDQDHAHGTVRPKVIILLDLILKFSNLPARKNRQKSKLKFTQ
jgi:ABC-type Zn2+ transport system substrate-binding protein/surface adhesin